MVFVERQTNPRIWDDTDPPSRKAVITQNSVMIYTDGEDPYMISKSEFDAMLAGDDPEAEPVFETCTAKKWTGKICGRDLPCRYHTDSD